MTRRSPTMADVARVAGVSPMTVSRAFRADGSVSAERRSEILAAAERMGYVFDATASNLRLQRTGFVAMTVPTINNANFADTVRGLTDGLAQRGLQVLLGATLYEPVEEERVIAQLLQRRPEAIVVTGGRHTERVHRLLSNAGIPVVETWDLPERPIGHVVGFSNAAAVRAMVEHFVQVGYRRMAFIGGDTQADARGADRRAGFVAALKEAGLDATRLIATGPPPISMREGARAMARLLHRYPDTEVAICVSDLSAFGALAECQRHAIEVPGHISIAGFGNFEVSAISVPSLTTIDAFAREIGTRAATLIADVLEKRQQAPRIEMIQPELILRESSR